ncbi:universal stress protein [Candidatus Neptunichlamydia sp. REUL1]|uniref:universal stress protein n=1 Tax=Candidatus Neptunichlamydia sp. REUL1 TaxID=3064277 RepID=UPI002931BC3D|nr:universal stress protein [Candidatus Neptunochlamydia sp. REUL1]
MAEKQSKISQIDKGSLRRVLSVGDLFAVGYGDLGSSIYYALGITTLFSLGAAPISLAIAGLVFACTALSYAELSAMLRDSGGSATFTRHAFNDLISFIAGWGLLLDFIVTIAISSFSIAPYLAFFVGGLKITSVKIGFTVCVIVILFIINYFGTKNSARMSWFLTTLTLSTQILIVIVGAIWFIHFPDLWEHLKIGIKGSSCSPSWPDFWKGTAMAMVAYTGIESMAQLGGEAKNPARTVPKAMMLAMGMLLFVYIGIAVVALSAVTPQELSTTFLEDPIAGIVSKFPYGGRVLGGWIGLLAVVTLFVASNAGLIGASRLCFNMGENYQLPRFVYKLHKKHKTPFVSLGIFAIFAIVIVLSARGKLDFLASLYNFGAMLAFFMTHLSLIFLRIRKPDAKRPFKVPFNILIGKYSIPITGVIGGLATAATWCLVVITKADGRNLGFLWIFFGLAIYYYFRKKQSIPPAGKVEIQKIKMPEFQAKKYNHILVPTRGGRETQTVQMACEIAKVHGADVTAVHVVEVPFSLPLETPLYHRTVVASSILNRAEAIGREFNVGVKLRVVHARTVDTAILELIEKEEYDLLVMGTVLSIAGASKGYGAVVERVLKSSTCPVWICCSAH